MIREKVEIKLLDENVSEFWKQTGANEQYDEGSVPFIFDIWARYTVGVYLAEGN